MGWYKSRFSQIHSVSTELTLINLPEMVTETYHQQSIEYDSTFT